MLIAVAALVMAGPSAHAETKTPGSAKPTLSAPTPGVSAQITATVSHGIWSCTLSANVPNRWYGGSGGGEQAFGSLNCTHVMPKIYILAGLVRNNSIVATAESEKTSATLTNALPSKSPHVSASYATAALATVTWPDYTLGQIPQITGTFVSL